MGQVVVAEYSDPNPFKVLHAGHFYTSVIGYSIGSLLEAAGAIVHRVNYGGDVGLHAGKTMWAILQELGGEHPEKLNDIPKEERSTWMAACYVRGTNTYEEDQTAKEDIRQLNKKLYQLHTDNDHTSPLAHIYWTCRDWSYEYFDQFYARIGTPFEKYYPESQVAPLGLTTVKEQLAKGVYEQSDGAVIFRGEPFGLHTRVFINQEGLPTYEAKDIGLIMQKYADYHFDKSVIITGNEQEQYMAVVLKSLEQFAPELARATTHFTHGMVRLKGGVKMSSRKGNILRAVDILQIAKEANKKATGRDDEQTVLGAIKYSFLRNRIGADVIFDPEESVSLEGNSGPYVQYAHARARSILAKSKVPVDIAQPQAALDPLERSLARKVAEYPEAVEKAVNEMLPHHICTYLYELAQTFNRFYEKSRVIGDEHEQIRLLLVSYYADVLKDGLQLLNIDAPEHL
jgi:arginyl-tRNA synthetase